MAKPWGESAKTFRAGTSRRNFITEDSLYRGDGKNGTIKDNNIVTFSDGWSANTFSLMAELEYLISTDTTLLISGRSDKSNFTSQMFSPRLALISHFDDNNTFKISWQRSLRMNTMIELYIEELESETSSPEKTQGFELSYIHKHSANMQSTVTAFQYNSEVISWSGTKAELIGEQKTTGIELEFAYQTDNFTLGFNHSFVKLDDWDFIAKENDGSKSQKVSLSDFLLNKDFLQFNSTGDSLIFWSENTTKLWTNFRINSQLTLHLDSQIMWKLQYGNDLFTMYNNSYAEVNTDGLSTKELETYNSNSQHLGNYNRAINQIDPYGRKIRFNASLIWKLPIQQNSNISLYAQNLVNVSDNTRHKSINYGSLPVSSWLNEPRSIWLTFDITF